MELAEARKNRTGSKNSLQLDVQSRGTYLADRYGYAAATCALDEDASDIPELQIGDTLALPEFFNVEAVVMAKSTT